MGKIPTMKITKECKSLQHFICLLIKQTDNYSVTKIAMIHKFCCVSANQNPIIHLM